MRYRLTLLPVLAVWVLSAEARAQDQCAQIAEQCSRMTGAASQAMCQQNLSSCYSMQGGGGGMMMPQMPAMPQMPYVPPLTRTPQQDADELARMLEQTCPMERDFQNRMAQIGLPNMPITPACEEWFARNGEGLVPPTPAMPQLPFGTAPAPQAPVMDEAAMQRGLHAIGQMLLARGADPARMQQMAAACDGGDRASCTTLMNGFDEICAGTAGFFPGADPQMIAEASYAACETAQFIRMALNGW
ncbi:hypothetical protein [Rubellimicrobium roseum]|uniref:Uncharacterized protein n=1 Tax=Rubellimicrobium roseum TaxID=687525 RepID=A0A5C4N7Q9_9RHOB|nr:hypothetical protein [Rubellimicrobium roseum]TNC59179.1 hypothetical protein FHG71_23060 [Rubellimicrobium roseum]